MIASLPPRYETVVVYDTTYYYADGTYYQPSSGGNYAVVAPPQGATVQNAPSQVTNVYVGGEEYGYSNGAYYDVKAPEAEGGDPTFEVVKPPVGATVPSLPDGATSETINGAPYFIYAGTYYKPFYSGSDVVYMVVENLDADTQGANESLSPDDRRLVQRALNQLGYNAGAEDGMFGKGTRAAISSWQRANGKEVTGYLTTDQAQALIAAGRK